MRHTNCRYNDRRRNKAGLCGIRGCLTDYKRDTYLTEAEQSFESNFRTIDCEVGYSPFGCSEQVFRAMAKFDFAKVARYPEMFYANLLKPLIINRFANAKLNPGNIFFGHGSFNIAERAIHKFVVPRLMLGYGPQFNEIPTEMESAGGKYSPIPLEKGFRFPLEKIVRALKQDKTVSVLYLDNPNNPTGNLISLNDIDRMVTEAEQRGIIVIVDEAYGDFVSDDYSAFNLVHKHSNLMVIRSFSKALGLAAQRIGYMAVSDLLVPYYEKVDVPFEPTVVSAVMASAVLEDRHFIDRVRDLSRKSKERIFSVLISKGLTVLPTHPDVSILMAHKPRINLFSHFQKMGIKIENGASYKRTNKSIDHSFIRLRVPNEREAMEVASRIKNWNFIG